MCSSVDCFDYSTASVACPWIRHSSIFDSPFQGQEFRFRRVLLTSPLLSCFALSPLVPRGYARVFRLWPNGSLFPSSFLSSSIDLLRRVLACLRDLLFTSTRVRGSSRFLCTSIPPSFFRFFRSCFASQATQEQALHVLCCAHVDLRDLKRDVETRTEPNRFGFKRNRLKGREGNGWTRGRGRVDVLRCMVERKTKRRSETGIERGKECIGRRGMPRPRACPSPPRPGPKRPPHPVEECRLFSFITLTSSFLILCGSCSFFVGFVRFDGSRSTVGVVVLETPLPLSSPVEHHNRNGVRFKWDGCGWETSTASNRR